VFIKGTENVDDGYSSFEAKNENLEAFLKSHEVETVYVAGLTIEYCVKTTALDSIKYGFETFVIKDAVEGIYQHEGDVEAAFEEMKNAGVKMITSAEVKAEGNLI
jgi:nicotinamidase/pyrazinamidase